MLKKQNSSAKKKEEQDDLARQEKFSSEIKQRILVSSLMALCIGNMMMMNVASFLPTFCSDKKWDNDAEVDEFFVSLILSIFSLAQILFAPFSSSIKN